MKIRQSTANKIYSVLCRVQRDPSVLDDPEYQKTINRLLDQAEGKFHKDCYCNSLPGNSECDFCTGLRS